MVEDQAKVNVVVVSDVREYDLRQHIQERRDLDWTLLGFTLRRAPKFRELGTSPATYTVIWEYHKEEASPASGD